MSFSVYAVPRANSREVAFDVVRKENSDSIDFGAEHGCCWRYQFHSSREIYSIPTSETVVSFCGLFDALLFIRKFGVLHGRP
jgi:hypothetical protein